MSEKYSEIFRLPASLYQEGCPVIVEAGTLLKKESTGNLIVQLKFLNIGQNVVTACKVAVTARDPFGNTVEEIPDFAFIDLNVPQGKNFGSNVPIYLNGDAARSYTPAITEVVLEDGTKWSTPETGWKELPAPVSLEEELEDPEMVKQFVFEAGALASYVPMRKDGLFFCTCGKVSMADAETCFSCGKETEGLLSLYADRDGLKARMEERLAKEEAEREERERQEAELREKQRLEEEERQRIAAERKAKTGKLLKILIPAAVVLAVIVAVLVKVVIPNVRQANAYKAAEALLAEGKYDEAEAAFGELGDYKDSPEMVKESLYQNAVSLMENGEFGEANIYFTALGDYKDSQDLTKETVYREAGELASAGQYEQAIDLYKGLSGYSDSDEMALKTEDLWKGADYEAAAALYEDGQKGKAIEAFRRLGDFRDAKDKVTEITYEHAGDKIKDKKYDEAVELLESIKGYKGADDLLLQVKYDKAEALFGKGSYKEAQFTFEQLDGYKDSVDRIKACKYQTALKELSKGNTKKAVTLFTELGDYEDARTQLLEVKYQYCTNNLVSTDKTTKKYLAELSEAGYKDSETLNKELYQWRVEIKVELAMSVGKRNEASIEVKVVSGPDGATTTLTAESKTPDGSTERFCDENHYKVGDTMYLTYSNDALYASYDITEDEFTVNIYDDSNHLAGSWKGVAGRG